jgi:hypothetical protein
MLRIAIALVILAHGIGHILFIVPLLGIADWGQSSVSWLLGADTAARVIGSLLWLIAIVGFAAAGSGLIGQQVWWRTVAVTSSVVSMVALLLFWHYPNTSSAFFAGAFDIAVLAALLIARWPSVEIIGA